MRSLRPEPPPAGRLGTRTARFGAIAVELFRSPPDLRLKTHGHDLVHYCLPIRGQFYEVEGGHEVLLEAGWMRASPPGDRHRIRFGPEAAECLLIFELPELATGRRSSLKSRRFLPLERAPSLARAILDEMRDPDLVSPLVVEAALVELSAQSCRPRRRAMRPPAWLLGVRERLEAASSEPPSLATLAAGAGVHRSQLVRAFRGHFGCSIGDFLRRRRLVAAVRQIATTANPLSQVAADCGFSDQSHLTRQVRAFTGEPPGRLRESLRARSGSRFRQPVSAS